MSLRPLLLLVITLLGLVRGYELVDDMSGIGFFDADNWDWFSSWDNLTLGDVNWMDEAGAYTDHLALVNAWGNVILKVDDFSNVPFNEKRNSVRITTKKSYELGSLWIIDAVHLPYGCSVSGPQSGRHLGPDWPRGGEIDIIEGINLMKDNQMALHTTPGCYHTTPPGQTGNSTIADCSNPAGCLVTERSPNSYREGFAAAGGGVWATQFDVAGIFIWFWSRPNVPASILHSTSTSGIDLSDWGPPSASFVNTSCTIQDFFGPQKLVIDITLCGQWAGIPSDYQETCGGAGPTGICYNDNVPGSGANYANAYFELKSVRTYTTAAPGASGAVAALGGHSGAAVSSRAGVCWTLLVVVWLGVITVILR
ncbi:Rhodanese domain-containing protein [Mycena kentingensis (nom. inval.)]|nr:Rhodanese domain-containing protein [Mycena kentingensis (nom. inval.)]